ncbi:MAG: hypothetical protein KA143_14500 [Saprospiraceae bacterium]|nr:hypothetical protein [Saprospiraceae bacterium]
MKNYLTKSTFIVLCLFSLLKAKAQNYIELSAGIASYHIPASRFTFSGIQPLLLSGIHRYTGPSQRLSLGMQLSFNKSKYQGNGIQIQGLISFMPDLGKHIQLSLSTGPGFQFSFYPSRPQTWKDDKWKEGKRFKGVITLPLQLSLAYKSIQTGHLVARPYIAYRLQGHFRYTPDLTPLPKSMILVGFTFNKNQF